MTPMFSAYTPTNFFEWSKLLIISNLIIKFYFQLEDVYKYQIRRLGPTWFVHNLNKDIWFCIYNLTDLIIIMGGVSRGIPHKFGTPESSGTLFQWKSIFYLNNIYEICILRILILMKGENTKNISLIYLLFIFIIIN